MKPEGYPPIHALRTGDEPFGWSVEVLLNGVLHTPRCAARSHTGGESMNPHAHWPFLGLHQTTVVTNQVQYPAPEASR
jgi:hypothetical protein